MIKIMNIMDAGLNKGALRQLNCSKGKILDIGCGGGKTVYIYEKNQCICFIAEK